MALSMQLHRVFAAIVVLVAVLGAEAHTCKHPSVRREWRALSTSERVEWITAVKVSAVFYAISGADLLQCLSKLPHDKALTPTVNSSISLIPPVDPNSSYYDGEFLSVSSVIFPTHCFRHCLRSHGPQYRRKRQYLLVRLS
jgi:hypothetical protein